MPIIFRADRGVGDDGRRSFQSGVGCLGSGDQTPLLDPLLVVFIFILIIGKISVQEGILGPEGLTLEHRRYARWR